MADKMNYQKTKAQMQSFAMGEAMAAAARDYQQEMLAAAAAAPGPAHAAVDLDDLLDDPELEALHAERLAALRAEAERRAAAAAQGTGALEELGEGEFLEAATRAPRLVCHFFHREFERCRVMDAHLAALAAAHRGTRFVKLHAPDAPFFVDKLRVRVLPCVVAFVGGVAVDRVVGFEGLGGGKDGFPRAALEAKLVAAGAVEPPPPARGGAGGGGDSDDDAARRGRVRRGGGPRRGGSDSDE